MRVKLRTLPGANSGVESNVSMLLTQSVFLGIFFGTYNIVAWTLLISAFDGKILAPAFLVSGIAGIIFIFLYRKLKSGFRLKNFTSINLIFCTSLAILISLLLYISSWQWIPFILFSMSVPLTMLVFFSFSENRIDLRKEDYFRILTERGLIAGITGISLLIPVLLYLGLSLRGIMLISPFSLAAASVSQYFLPAKSDFRELTSERVAFKDLRKDQSSRMIAVFACISVSIVLIIQYAMVGVARMQFMVDNDMAAFLGFFTAGIMILAYTGKLLIFPAILQNYGLRSGIIAPPLVVAILIAIVLALRLAIGINAVTYAVFLILFALASLFSYVLILSVQLPSLRVILHSSGMKAKGILQAGIGWTVVTALLVSGIILTIAGLFFSGLIYFLSLLMPLIALWFYVAFRMHDAYRNQVVMVIDNHEAVDTQTGALDLLRNRFAGKLLFKTNYYSLISGDYSVLNATSNKWYFEEIIDNAWSKKDINLLPVLRKISLKEGLDEGIRKKSSEVLNILQKKTVFFKYEDEKIAEAVKILSGTRIPQTTQILSLLRDKSIESKKLAIYMIGKFGLIDLLSVVCDCLNNPGLAKEAYAVLKSFGRDAENELMRFYLVSSGNSKLSKIIIQLLQQVQTNETTNFLFSRLGSNSRQLKELVLKYLLDNNFRPSEDEKKRLDYLASDTIGILTWNLSAKISLEKDNDDFLLDKINSETKRWEAFLLNTLSVIYGSGPVQRIRQSMSDRTIEGASATSEIAGILITGSVAPKLSAYLKVPDKWRLEKLFQFYPGELASHSRLLEDIINRDYNLLGLWTKASALRSITDIQGDEIIQSITALLFSQEELIQEETARLIAKTNPGLYYSASPRLPEATRHRLDGIISGTADPKHLLYEKVQFLAKILNGIPEDELLPLASELNYLKYFESEIVNSSDGCIVWHLNDRENEPLIFYKGETEIIVRKLRNRESFYMLALTAIEEYHFRFPEQSGVILKYVDEKQS